MKQSTTQKDWITYKKEIKENLQNFFDLKKSNLISKNQMNKINSLSDEELLSSTTLRSIMLDQTYYTSPNIVKFLTSTKDQIEELGKITTEAQFLERYSNPEDTLNLLSKYIKDENSNLKILQDTIDMSLKFAEAEDKKKLAKQAKEKAIEEKAKSVTKEKEIEEKAKSAAKEKTKKEESKKKYLEEQKSKKEAEQKAKKEAEEKARTEAEEKARTEAEEKARKEAERSEKSEERRKNWKIKTIKEIVYGIADNAVTKSETNPNIIEKQEITQLNINEIQESKNIKSEEISEGRKRQEAEEQLKQSEENLNRTEEQLKKTLSKLLEKERIIEFMKTSHEEKLQMEARKAKMEAKSEFDAELTDRTDQLEKKLKKQFESDLEAIKKQQEEKLEQNRRDLINGFETRVTQEVELILSQKNHDMAIKDDKIEDLQQIIRLQNHDIEIKDDKIEDLQQRIDLQSLSNESLSDEIKILKSREVDAQKLSQEYRKVLISNQEFLEEINSTKAIEENEKQIQERITTGIKLAEREIKREFEKKLAEKVKARLTEIEKEKATSGSSNSNRKPRETSSIEQGSVQIKRKKTSLRITNLTIRSFLNPTQARDSRAAKPLRIAPEISPLLIESVDENFKKLEKIVEEKDIAKLEQFFKDHKEDAIKFIFKKIDDSRSIFQSIVENCDTVFLKKLMEIGGKEFETPIRKSQHAYYVLANLDKDSEDREEKIKLILPLMSREVLKRNIAGMETMLAKSIRTGDKLLVENLIKIDITLNERESHKLIEKITRNRALSEEVKIQKFKYVEEIVGSDKFLNSLNKLNDKKLSVLDYAIINGDNKLALTFAQKKANLNLQNDSSILEKFFKYERFEMLESFYDSKLINFSALDQKALEGFKQVLSDSIEKGNKIGIKFLDFINTKQQLESQTPATTTHPIYQSFGSVLSR